MNMRKHARPAPRGRDILARRILEGGPSRRGGRASLGRGRANRLQVAGAPSGAWPAGAGGPPIKVASPPAPGQPRAPRQDRRVAPAAARPPTRQPARGSGHERGRARPQVPWPRSPGAARSAARGQSPRPGPARRPAAPGRQEARALPPARPPRRARSPRRLPRRRPGARACRHRRCLPGRLRRHRRRREGRQRLPRPARDAALPRQPRDRLPARHGRQRLPPRLAPLPAAVPAAEAQAPPRPAARAPNQRQGRAARPDRAARVGLRPLLRQLRPARRLPAGLAASPRPVPPSRQPRLPCTYPIVAPEHEQRGGFTQLARDDNNPWAIAGNRSHAGAGHGALRAPCPQLHPSRCRAGCGKHRGQPDGRWFFEVNRLIRLESLRMCPARRANSTAWLVQVQPSRSFEQTMHALMGSSE